MPSNIDRNGGFSMRPRKGEPINDDEKTAPNGPKTADRHEQPSPSSDRAREPAQRPSEKPGPGPVPGVRGPVMN